MSKRTTSTIAAIATPPGCGGVGVVRVSGPLVPKIAQTILGFSPKPRYAHFAPFFDQDQQPIDAGIALYFSAPHSFTGEDVLELQGHGGPMVLQLVLKRVFACGASPAQAGEFTERAYLNDKIDLAQAEAIADLIHASSEQAARSAMRSLQGVFSQQCEGLRERILALRVYVEAAIDFPDEDVDFLSDGHVEKALTEIIEASEQLMAQAQQGVLLQQGMTVVIAGRPNAGKSSLLNLLASKEVAIVTDIPGTTRDVLREWVQIDGMPLHILDTAGLRETDDRVEQAGVARARHELSQADCVLWVCDPRVTLDLDEIPPPEKTILVRNKIDLTEEAPGRSDHHGYETIQLSAKTGQGMDALKQALKNRMGYEQPLEDTVTARARHLDAIRRSLISLRSGEQQLKHAIAGELLAEELKQAHAALGEVVGAMSADALLGEIFSSFCIGK
jgi:tRNA modification GTPase